MSKSRRDPHDVLTRYLIDRGMRAHFARRGASWYLDRAKHPFRTRDLREIAQYIERYTNDWIMQ